MADKPTVVHSLILNGPMVRIGEEGKPLQLINCRNIVNIVISSSPTGDDPRPYLVEIHQINGEVINFRFPNAETSEQFAMSLAAAAK